MDGGTRVCVPVIEGSDCTGVLALTLEGSLDDTSARRCEELGMLVVRRFQSPPATPIFNLVRRRRAMTLPASIQWDLLPPLRLMTPEATSSGSTRAGV